MFEVASIHFTRDCNLNCSFCYRPKKSVNELPLGFWYDIIPHLKKLGVPQVALGGGEPMLYPEFVRRLGEVCKKEGMVLNITSNGKLMKNIPNLKKVLENVTMVSLSFDKVKVKSTKDFVEYMDTVRLVKKTGTKVGCNLLVDNTILRGIRVITHLLFERGVDRIYVLYPKNFRGPDILKYKFIYYYLTEKYKHFYVDDLTRTILYEGKYTGWKNPCHFGKLISIDEQGYVKGCSFDDKSVLKLKKPEDILKVKDIKFEVRKECPYLLKP